MAESLFYAVFVGVGLGLLFDILRLPRLIFNDRFFFDFLFWILSALVTFCYFLVFNNGSIRSINLICIFIGFLLFTFTLGLVTGPLHIKIAKKIKIRLKSFKKVLQKIYNIYYNIKDKLKKIFRKNPKGGKNGQGSRKEE